MLTPRQKAFADYFIECGNASEAAKKAGYKPQYAATNTEKLLKNTNISAYIKERMGNQDAERVASADEVLQFYTDVMRGKVKDAFGMDPGLSDRLKAADSLYKRYAAVNEKQKGTMEKLDALLEEMQHAADLDA